MSTFIRDYCIFVFVCTAMASLWFTLWRFFTPLDKYGKPKEPNADDTSKGGDPVTAKNRIKEIYNLKLEPADEKPIPIKALYLYPVRGIKGIRVDVAEIQPFGLKNDRQWVIIDKEKMKPVANHNSHLITFLRQIMLPKPG